MTGLEAVVIGAFVGMVLAFIVTTPLHEIYVPADELDERPGWRDLVALDGWGRRLGRTRFRYANLPVGGAALAIAGVLVDVVELRAFLMAAGAGAALVAVAMRWLDPLDPVT